MHLLVSLLVWVLRAVLTSRRSLALENLALRQQLAAYTRTQKRPRLKSGERAFIALCFDAFAFIFVPSNATLPSLTSRAFFARPSTWVNSSARAFRWTRRNSLMRVWSGWSPPAMTRHATSSHVFFSIFRDDATPTQYPYTSKLVIMTG